MREPLPLPTHPALRCKQPKEDGNDEDSDNVHLILPAQESFGHPVRSHASGAMDTITIKNLAGQNRRVPTPPKGGQDDLSDEPVLELGLSWTRVQWEGETPCTCVRLRGADRVGLHLSGDVHRTDVGTLQDAPLSTVRVNDASLASSGNDELIDESVNIHDYYPPAEISCSLCVLKLLGYTPVPSLKKQEYIYIYYYPLINFPLFFHDIVFYIPL